MCFRQCLRFINVSSLCSYVLFSTTYCQPVCLNSGKSIAASLHCWICLNISRNHYVACISMDLSKAFDCLPHCLIICKLYAYWVSRQACILIARYLQLHKQRIKLGNSRTEWTELRIRSSTRIYPSSFDFQHLPRSHFLFCHWKWLI